MRRLVAVLATVALGISMLALTGAAQTDLVYRYEYSVKVVQGPCDNEGIGWGMFFTTVNIHNPWQCQAVHYRIKLAVAGYGGGLGPVPSWVDPRQPLIADGVTEYDGAYFYTMPTYPQIPGGVFFEGYFVIQSEDELDVVAVYTGSGFPDPKSQLATMYSERVPARRIEVCAKPEG
ncbi:MAG: hypothetical protein ABFD77_10200 [Thermotogota bacterium]